MYPVCVFASLCSVGPVYFCLTAGLPLVSPFQSIIYTVSRELTKCFCHVIFLLETTWCFPCTFWVTLKFLSNFSRMSRAVFCDLSSLASCGECPSSELLHCTPIAEVSREFHYNCNHTVLQLCFPCLHFFWLSWLVLMYFYFCLLTFSLLDCRQRERQIFQPLIYFPRCSY